MKQSNLFKRATLPALVSALLLSACTYEGDTEMDVDVPIGESPDSNLIEPAAGKLIDSKELVEGFHFDGYVVQYHEPEIDKTGASMSSAAIDYSTFKYNTLQTLNSKFGDAIEVVREISDRSTLIRINRNKLSIASNDQSDDGDVIKALSEQENVTVEKNIIVYPTLVPNDPRSRDQWHYTDAPGGINAQLAWDDVDAMGLRSNGEPVVVSVIDTGVHLTHEDLSNQMLPGYDFISSADRAKDGNGRDADASDSGDWAEPGECVVDGNGGRNTSLMPSSFHGTHVAGTIAAETDNGLGVAGVAWNAKILPVRVLGSCGGSSADIADAIRWSAGLSVPGVPDNANPAQVINLSLGGYSRTCPSFYQAAINDAVEAGATIVVAAGNSNTNVSTSTPANCDNVIVVAASGRDGSLSSYSNYGEKIDVLAPGGNRLPVLSTVATGQRQPIGDGYAGYNGTSMATPHVAGVVAMMIAKNDTLSPAEIETLLKANGKPFNANAQRPCSTRNCGDSAVDAPKVLAAFEADNITPEEPPEEEEETPTEPPEDDNPEVPEPESALTNGVIIDGLSLNTGESKKFYIDLPANVNKLSIATAGSNGDADILLGREDYPTNYNDAIAKGDSSDSKEQINVNSPLAGRYFVVLYAYRSFSNLKLLASFDTISTFSNTRRYAIWDRYTTSSPIEVPRQGATGTITVSIDIDHTYRGDLTVVLDAPSGERLFLFTPSNDSRDGIKQSFSLNQFEGIESSGIWTLRIYDGYTADQGVLNGWSITFQ